MGAKMFGFGQKLIGGLFTVVFIAGAIAATQAGMMLYAGYKTIPAKGNPALESTMKEIANDAAAATASPVAARKKLTDAIRQILTRHGGGTYVKDSVRPTLLSLGEFRDANDLPAERFELAYDYDLSVNLLWTLEFRNTFSGEVVTVVKPGSGLKPLVDR